MSADNTIFVQKRLDGNWWVWMGLGDDGQVPNLDSQSFKSMESALCYAQGWLRGESVVEYGVQVLDEQVEEEKCLDHPCVSKAKCPHCNETIFIHLSFAGFDWRLKGTE